MEELLAALEDAQDALGSAGPPDHAIGVGSLSATAAGPVARPDDPDATEPNARAVDSELSTDIVAVPEPRDLPTTARLVGTDGKPIEPGTHVRYFGDYEIRQEIGRGGMGAAGPEAAPSSALRAPSPRRGEGDRLRSRIAWPARRDERAVTLAPTGGGMG